MILWYLTLVIVRSKKKFSCATNAGKGNIVSQLENYFNEINEIRETANKDYRTLEKRKSFCGEIKVMVWCSSATSSLMEGKKNVDRCQRKSQPLFDVITSLDEEVFEKVAKVSADLQNRKVDSDKLLKSHPNRENYASEFKKLRKAMRLLYEKTSENNWSTRQSIQEAEIILNQFDSTLAEAKKEYDHFCQSENYFTISILSLFSLGIALCISYSIFMRYKPLRTLEENPWVYKLFTASNFLRLIPLPQFISLRSFYHSLKSNQQSWACLCFILFPLIVVFLLLQFIPR